MSSIGRAERTSGGDVVGLFAIMAAVALGGFCTGQKLMLVSRIAHGRGVKVTENASSPNHMDPVRIPRAVPWYFSLLGAEMYRWTAQKTEDVGISVQTGGVARR